MKFIREMIARKNRAPEMGARSDDDDFEMEDIDEYSTGIAAPVSIQSIQARLQGALTKSDSKGAGNGVPDNGRGAVEDFRDIVSGRPRPQQKDAEQRNEIDEPSPDEEFDIGKLAELDLVETLDEPQSPDFVAASTPEESRESANRNVLEVVSQKLESRERSDVPSAQEPPVSASRPKTPEVVNIITARASTLSGPAAEHTPTQPEPDESHADDELGTDGSSVAEADPSTDSDRVNKAALPEAARIPRPVTPFVEVPAPSAGRSGRRAGRVKTRLLGFEHAHGSETDPFDATPDNAGASQGKFPAGWMVVVKGLGRGSSFMLNNGVSQIGRGEDQAIRLDFGDSSISRNNHAAIAYDSEQRAFFIGHGGKANLVRLNNKPVLSTEELATGDLIRIGETVLHFVGLCGPDFDWEADEEHDADDAAIA